jgi:hypothetical protein
LSAGTKNQVSKIKKLPSPYIGLSGPDPSPLSSDSATIALVESRPTLSLPWRSPRRRYLQQPGPLEELCRRGALRSCTIVKPHCHGALKSHNRHQAMLLLGHVVEYHAPWRSPRRVVAHTLEEPAPWRSPRRVVARTLEEPAPWSSPRRGGARVAATLRSCAVVRPRHHGA